MANTYNITLIPGDGTGPELTEAMRRTVEATGVSINWDVQEAGINIMEKCGTPLPDSTLASVRKNKIAIKGPITTPLGKGFRSVNVALRKQLDLYVCLRPCKYYAGTRSKYPKTDIIIVRENTEDLYAGIEFKSGEQDTNELINYLKGLGASNIRAKSGISIKPISEEGSSRIIRFAFDYAVKHSRKKVTAVTKSNIMKFTDGLFQSVATEIAKEYSNIEFEHILVDNLCMQLVQRPEYFDILVLPNLYGDIVSDLCAGLIGGLGVAPGANIGTNCAVFEPTHGSAPKYTGLNKVDPTALILSAVMMLRYINENAAADKLENAVSKVIAEGKYVTYDLKQDRNDPTAVGTKEMADAIIREM